MYPGSRRSPLTGNPFRREPHPADSHETILLVTPGRLREGGGGSRPRNPNASDACVAWLYHRLCVAGGVEGLDSLSAEFIFRRAMPAERIVKMASKLPLPVPDPSNVRQRGGDGA